MSLKLTGDLIKESFGKPLGEDRKKRLRRLLSMIKTLARELKEIDANAWLGNGPVLHQAYGSVIKEAKLLDLGNFSALNITNGRVYSIVGNLRLLESEVEEEIGEASSLGSSFEQKKRLKEVSGIDALSERNIHSRLIEVSGQLFANKHYAQAIFEAFKEVEATVRDKSGLTHMDGTKLMTSALNLKNPKLKFSDLKSRSDRDEQEGFMHIFMGTMLGIRNPKAHYQIEQKDPVKTLEYLALASLLLRIVDEAEVSEIE